MLINFTIYCSDGSGKNTATINIQRDSSTFSDGCQDMFEEGCRDIMMQGVWTTDTTKKNSSLCYWPPWTIYKIDNI